MDIKDGLLSDEEFEDFSSYLGFGVLDKEYFSMILRFCWGLQPSEQSGEKNSNEV